MDSKFVTDLNNTGLSTTLICISSINAKQQTRLTWNQQYSEINLLEKLE